MAQQASKDLIDECRREVDNELTKLREEIHEHAWTEERAEKLAQDVLKKCVPLIKESLLTDLKINVGSATLNMLRNAAYVTGAAVIGLAIWLSEAKFPWR